MKDLQKLYIYCSPNSDFLDEVGKVAEEETQTMAQLFDEMCPSINKKERYVLWQAIKMFGSLIATNTVKELIKKGIITEVKWYGRKD